MTSSVQKVLINTDSLKKVTVFEDRAELKREFTIKLNPGSNEVIVENITRNVHDDSVRVTGRGDAVIEEVQVADRRSKTGDGDSERAKELRSKIEDLKTKLNQLTFQKTSLTNQVDALDGMLKQVGTGIACPKDARFTADTQTFESITSFFAFYNDQSTKLRGSLEDEAKNMNTIQEEINALENQLREIDNGTYMKVISIFMDSKEGGDVVLELTYQVWGAHWYPLYDIRVETTNGKSNMQVSYYANVNQSTSEDWEGGELVLSTARPSLGGSIPELGTLDVAFYRPPQASPPRMYTAVAARGNAMMTKALCADFGGAQLECAMVDRVAEVSSQTLSTEFLISRPVAIPSDGAQHKVTIGVMSLTPTLVHETVPTKNPLAFLTASCVNSSSLPFLRGQASVFLDGAFVAKTDMKAASPGEQFSSSLGVDPAVKIDYKPVHKYHEQVGLINKASVTIHEQKIIIKNTRADTILLIVKEQIPRSTDDKIKVNVISPPNLQKTDDSAADVNATPSEGARMLPSNNIEWTVKVGAGEQKPMTVKFSVEHPVSEKIEFHERFN